jgi:hypothetical protein
VAVAVRGLVKTEMAQGGPPSKALPLPNRFHKLGWLAVFNASLLAAVLAPSYAPMLAAPFLLSGTVGGYLVGISLPPGVKKVGAPNLTQSTLSHL